jgi:hypothetical protein
MSESDEDKPRRKRSASADVPSKAVSRDAPSKQTLIMLGIISVATLLLWGAGRAACNYQVPGESLTPRPVSLEERTRTAKDVGFEFAQCLSSGRFDDALSIATREAADLVKKEKSSCGACADRKSAQKTIFSTATVLKANSVDALVKVRTVGAPGGEVTRFLGIEREGRKWLVSRLFKDPQGVTLKEAPPQSGSAQEPVPPSAGELPSAGEAQGEGDFEAGAHAPDDAGDGLPAVNAAADESKPSEAKPSGAKPGEAKPGGAKTSPDVKASQPAASQP